MYRLLNAIGRRASQAHVLALVTTQRTDRLQGGLQGYFGAQSRRLSVPPPTLWERVLNVKHVLAALPCRTAVTEEDIVQVALRTTRFHTMDVARASLVFEQLDIWVVGYLGSW